MEQAQTGIGHGPDVMMVGDQPANPLRAARVPRGRRAQKRVVAREVQPLPPPPATGAGHRGQYGWGGPAEQHRRDPLWNPNLYPAVGLADVVQERGQQQVGIATAAADEPVVYRKQMTPVVGS